MAEIIPEKFQSVLDEHNVLFSGKENLQVKEYKGFQFLPYMEPETARYAMEEWNMPENSVFLVTHPKTGTNWGMEILSQILFARDEENMKKYNSVPKTLYFMETTSTRKFKLLDYLKLPRLPMSTHVDEELFDFEKVKQRKGKVIYIIRNPKDRLVSFFHFMNNFPRIKYLEETIGVEWNEYFDNYMMGKHPINTRKGENYPDHILGWLKHKDDKDFLLLVYEDMKKDLKREVARIAAFLQIQLTAEEVTSITNACTFTSMKKNVEEQSGVLKTVGIMRKGEVGGWKDQFTVAQSEQMDKQIEEKLGHTGIQFIYEL